MWCRVLLLAAVTVSAHQELAIDKPQTDDWQPMEPQYQVLEKPQVLDFEKPTSRRLLRHRISNTPKQQSLGVNVDQGTSMEHRLEKTEVSPTRLLPRREMSSERKEFHGLTSVQNHDRQSSTENSAHKQQFTISEKVQPIHLKISSSLHLTKLQTGPERQPLDDLVRENTTENVLEKTHMRTSEITEPIRLEISPSRKIGSEESQSSDLALNQDLSKNGGLGEPNISFLEKMQPLRLEISPSRQLSRHQMGSEEERLSYNLKQNVDLKTSVKNSFEKLQIADLEKMQPVKIEMPSKRKAKNHRPSQHLRLNNPKLMRLPTLSDDQGDSLRPLISSFETPRLLKHRRSPDKPLVDKSEEDDLEKQPPQVEECGPSECGSDGWWSEAVRRAQRSFAVCRKRTGLFSSFSEDLVLSAVRLKNCLKEDFLRSLDDSIKEKELPLTPFVTIIRENESQDLGPTDPRQDAVREDLISSIYKRFSTLLDTHSFKFNFSRLWSSPFASETESGEEEVGDEDGAEVEIDSPRSSSERESRRFGRRRRHRQYRKAFPMMVAGYMMMSAFMVPLGFQFMAMIGGKALLLAKLAFFMSLFSGYKRLTNDIEYHHHDLGHHHEPHHHHSDFLHHYGFHRRRASLPEVPPQLDAGGPFQGLTPTAWAQLYRKTG